jgi:hypothetical protein
MGIINMIYRYSKGMPVKPSRPPPNFMGAVLGAVVY